MFICKFCIKKVQVNLYFNFVWQIMFFLLFLSLFPRFFHTKSKSTSPKLKVLYFKFGTCTLTFFNLVQSWTNDCDVCWKCVARPLQFAQKSLLFTIISYLLFWFLGSWILFLLAGLHSFCQRLVVYFFWSIAHCCWTCCWIFLVAHRRKARAWVSGHMIGDAFFILYHPLKALSA